MEQQSSEKVRWGILGCGDVTEVKSGPALQKVDRSEVHSVMRRDQDKAADYARRHGVPDWTSDASALLANPDLDAIYIATPPNSHKDYAIAALRAGKDVLLEKPMGMTPDECAAIEAVVQETGRKLCVAYYRRALSRFEKMRKLVQSGAIGEVRLIEVRHFLTAETKPGQAWKLDEDTGGGGYFVDVQSHTLDWLTYVFGAPRAATGLKKHQSKLYPAEDLVTYLLDFETISAVGLCAYAISEEEEKVMIHGDKGSVSMSFFSACPIELRLDGTVATLEYPDPEHVHQPFIERVIAHFLDGAPNPCSASEGRLSTDLKTRIFQGF
ncbi:Predicted dehydrogenase [Cohaesibacter sp. ES.047]|uniref:Gfo/Idh/MocA family protein n=1 Tax=Cohaesibacter sp. ES.047 TaxID=1798205 RepID=UPI000BBFF8CD|nr:Gfo/Idh/MocA family oxidoreductase [Cohaesibacter sp. ES.047]SNY93943.1 Predicted dehydrogenase [Cohaesibacter sp. ES.047]